MSLTPFDIFLSLLIGIGTGIILQRGRVCTNTAFRNLLIIRNVELSLVIVVTVSIELIGYQLLVLIPILGFTFQSNPISFSILVLPVGAFIFGFGTVIAGGCAGGVCYRIGEGSAKSLLAFIGFAAGIGLIAINPINNVVENLRNSTLWLIEGQTPSLELFLPREFWTFGAIILIIGSIYYYRIHTPRLTHLRPHWTPIISGALLGLLGVIARVSSTLTGRAFGFSTTDGIGEIFSSLIGLFDTNSPFQLGWAGLFIIGVIVGSALSSFQIKEFKLKLPSLTDTFRFFGGGMMLGVGAMLALGCNFGHILGGVPELGLSSFFAIIFMILGNWLGSYLLYIRFQRSLPYSTPIL